jgi:hypothetical protein
VGNGKSLMWVGGNGDRQHHDFYNTPADCTEAFVRWAIEKGVLKPPEDIVWECACGEGALSEVLKAHEMTVFSSDLRHTGYGKGGVNFLQYTSEGGLFTAVVTNPPFYFSVDFIVQAHALGIPTVCLLLKSTYFHAKCRVPLFRKYPPSWVLPLTWRPSMNPQEGNSGGLMDFSWYVWQKGSQGTRFDILERPNKKDKV